MVLYLRICKALHQIFVESSCWSNLVHKVHDHLWRVKISVKLKYHQGSSISPRKLNREGQTSSFSASQSFCNERSTIYCIVESRQHGLPLLRSSFNLMRGRRLYTLFLQEYQGASLSPKQTRLMDLVAPKSSELQGYVQPSWVQYTMELFSAAFAETQFWL